MPQADQLALTRSLPHPETLERLKRRATELFAPLGAAVEFVDDHVLVNGAHVHLDGDIDSTLDRFGLDHFREQLEESVQSEIVSRVAGVCTRHRPMSVEILRNGGRVALIKPTHASLQDPTGSPIAGNFLVPGGRHWEHLGRHLDASSTKVVIDFPASASAEERRRAAAASKVIRDARQRHFDDAEPALTDIASGRRIVFSPISTSGPLEAPFEFTGDEYSVRGALRLRTPHGPLALALAEAPVEEEILVTVWLYCPGSLCAAQLR